MTRLRDLVRLEPKGGPAMPAWLERIASAGVVTTDPRIARRQRITNIAAYAAAANAVSHLVINSVYDFNGLFIVNIYNVLFTLAALLVPRIHRYGENAGGIVLVSSVLLGNMFVVWMLGRASDLQIYFTLAGAVLFFFGVQNWKLFLLFFVTSTGVLLLTLNFAPVDGYVMPHDVRLREMLSSHAYINAITINAAMIFYALTVGQRAETELETQYARSEALIETIMPAAIAERLKSGTERIADRIDNLSVLFADLVGFTSAAHDLPPDAVVDYLDSLVRTFDQLCEEHGVEKIKTIGDSYMAAGGLDGRAHEGAIGVGRLGLAMLDAIAKLPPLGGRRMAMRIGIHCGEATAGVIGDMRFSYDVWGDAVNVASRMESHGVPNRIQASEAFRDLTREAFVFEEAGATDIKGIGMARTYFLLRRAS